MLVQHNEAYDLYKVRVFLNTLRHEKQTIFNSEKIIDKDNNAQYTQYLDAPFTTVS